MKTWVKALIGIAIALVVLLVVAYFGMGYGIYSQLGNVQGSCDTHQANRPDSIQANDAWPPIDLTRYTMSPYETVRFPSREAGIEIAGWWIERDPQAPAVLLVHGFGGCKNAIDVLVPAGMLWRNGFNVLLIDLRDIGESGTDDMRSAIGNDEYLDVLGAWDWLVKEKGIDPKRIGLFANSLGGASANYAFSRGATHRGPFSAVHLRQSAADHRGRADTQRLSDLPGPRRAGDGQRGHRAKTCSPAARWTPSATTPAGPCTSCTPAPTRGSISARASSWPRRPRRPART